MFDHTERSSWRSLPNEIVSFFLSFSDASNGRFCSTSFLLSQLTVHRYNLFLGSGIFVTPHRHDLATGDNSCDASFPTACPSLTGNRGGEDEIVQWSVNKMATGESVAPRPREITAKQCRVLCTFFFFFSFLVLWRIRSKNPNDLLCRSIWFLARI